MTSPMEPVFSLKEAATATGVSVSTIRRKKALLCEYGTTTDKSGWVIPASALIAAGFSLDTVTPQGGFQVTPPGCINEIPDGTPLNRLIEAYEAQIDLLQTQLAREIARAGRAERNLELFLPSKPAPRPSWWKRLFN